MKKLLLSFVLVFVTSYCFAQSPLIFGYSTDTLYTNLPQLSSNNAYTGSNSFAVFTHLNGARFPTNNTFATDSTGVTNGVSWIGTGTNGSVNVLTSTQGTTVSNTYTFASDGTLGFSAVGSASVALIHGPVTNGGLRFRNSGVPELVQGGVSLFDILSTGPNTASGKVYGFSSTTDPNTAPDTAISRFSAGVIGVGGIASTNGLNTINTNQFTIAATGWTNTNAFNCVAYPTATAVVITHSDGTNTIQTVTASTGTSFVLHPSYKITAAAGLGGVAIAQ